MTAPTVTGKDAALRAAVLHALADLISAEKDAARAQVHADLTALAEQVGATTISVTLPGGATIATISLTGGKPGPRVVDEQAFVEWAQYHHPGEITVGVRDSFKKKVLADVERTGEVPPGVEFVEGRPGIALRFKDGGRDAVAEAWRTGTLPAGVGELTAGGAA